jgi:DNA-binding PucR family transcriptional regulator
VLNAIIAGQDQPESSLLEQLALLGWQVHGWCTAISLQASGDVDPLRILNLTDELSRQLEASGVSGPLIERPDGWTLWIASAQEPLPHASTELVHAVSRALRRFTAGASRIRVHAGIGRPSYGISGLRDSLAESKEVATVAQAGGDAFGVQHVDEMGVRRILLGWYASESFAEFARTLLGPLLAVDGDGELLMTLESYLDNESSATLTAAHLAVHRNTVMNRLERLRTLLAVNLDSPDERLAVQLACRVVKLKGTDGSRSR